LDTWIQYIVMPTKDAAETVAQHLRRQITLGQLAPGAPLRQEAVAKELGISRMPVRDAFKALSAEGLVVLYPNRGTYVATLSEEECSEIFDLRVLLETDALRRAIPYHTDASCRKLRFVQGELEFAKERPQWLAGDREFHCMLYSPSARPLTLEMIQGLRDRVERFYQNVLQPSDHRQGWRNEHHLILEAVEARDIDRAQTALGQHLREAEQIVRTRLSQLRQGGESS
jgi:DNA-binding GntR family transcriptional regulator